MSAIRSLQSRRVLFAIVSDILGIRDLAHLVEDYACRCEGHSTLPFTMPWFDEVHLDSEYGELYHYIYPNNIVQCHSIEGEERHHFPVGFQVPSSHNGLFMRRDYIVWLDQDNEIHYEARSHCETVTHSTETKIRH
jgi:hypothetical protein